MKLIGTYHNKNQIPLSLLQEACKEKTFTSGNRVFFVRDNRGKVAAISYTLLEKISWTLKNTSLDMTQFFPLSQNWLSEKIDIIPTDELQSILDRVNEQREALRESDQKSGSSDVRSSDTATPRLPEKIRSQILAIKQDIVGKLDLEKPQKEIDQLATAFFEQEDYETTRKILHSFNNERRLTDPLYAKFSTLCLQQDQYDEAIKFEMGIYEHNLKLDEFLLGIVKEYLEDGGQLKQLLYLFFDAGDFQGTCKILRHLNDKDIADSLLAEFATLCFQQRRYIEANSFIIWIYNREMRDACYSSKIIF